MKENIIMRLTKKDKNLIKQACKIVGLKFSAFCRTESIKKAREILKKHGMEDKNKK